MQDFWSDIEIHEAIRARWGDDWFWNSGVLPDYDIWLPVEGAGVIECDGVCRPAARGDCFFLRKGRRYLARQDPGVQLQTLGIHLDFLDANGARIDPADLPPLHCKLADAPFVIGLAERAVDAWRRDNPALRDPVALSLWGKALFHEVVAQGLQASESGVQRGQRIMIERLCRKLTTQPSKAPSVEQMAQQLGCSRWQCCRLFRTHTGRSPQAYLRDARIAQAKHYLESRPLSVCRIASLLGYTDASHFNHYFGRHAGLSPAAYRRQTRR